MKLSYCQFAAFLSKSRTSLRNLTLTIYICDISQSFVSAINYENIFSSRHYFCFLWCAAVRCMVGCLLAFIFLNFFYIYAISKQVQRKLHTVKFNKRGTATVDKCLIV
jgi:hypothetical protein